MPTTTAGPEPRLSLSIQSGDGAPAWPVHRSRLRRWAAAALHTDARIVLRLVGAREARALNRDYRGRDYATNVLTFVYDAPPPVPAPVPAAKPRRAEGAQIARRGATVADIVICLAVVTREAREQRKPLEQHLAHLVVHGVLHAQGFDHETDSDTRAMEAREREVLARFRVPDPYLDAYLDP